ncbi:MAG: SMC family ATPase, partial [Nocardioides sp.]
MRLHQLDVQAFGPFATSISVDFDDLSDAGLFLLSGATGAGKTSVLDAVCFALYGDVPGDRSSAKRLRSDQAAADVVPRVTLDVTLSGRRFRIVRSPAWERAKKRGTGTTVQQACVTISEFADQQWQPLSSRIDETGDLVTRLVGMNLPQFTQVAMLPQGRFQAFLRAGSDDRHKLLQQLFRTGRFEDVERWLRDRRIAVGAQAARHHEQVADVVSRLSEVTETALPAHWDLHDLTPLDRGELSAWADDHTQAAALALAATAQEAELAGVVEREARAALEGARDLAARRAQY